MAECFTTSPISPGQCTNNLQHWNGSSWVAGCDQLSGNREIMVNPQVQSTKPTPVGYPGYVAECSCKDNWSLYSGATCGPPSCGSITNAMRKTNIYFMVDKSASMESGGVWTPTVNALKTFFQASTSAGIGTALELFPSIAVTTGPPGTTHDGCDACDALPCSNPRVPLGTLTVSPAPGDSQEKASVDVLNAESANGSGTPMYPALDGALQWATAQKASKPNEDFSVVLLTDGDPSGCNNSITAIAALASAAYQANGTKTHVVALPGSTTWNLDQIAIAGGTGGAIQTTPGLTAELVLAFQSIAAAGAQCDFALPSSSQYDKTNVTATFTSSTGTQTILTKRNALAACGSGWYFDDNTTPTKALLCPTTCAAAKADTGSSVSINLGCP